MERRGRRCRRNRAGGGRARRPGNALADGDSVVVLKDLKVKGSSSVVKGGTKVRNIRLTDASDGHNIACKIDGIGAMNLKSEFVKKA
jgi:protein PhnA